MGAEEAEAVASILFEASDDGGAGQQRPRGGRDSQTVDVSGPEEPNATSGMISDPISFPPSRWQLRSPFC